MKQLCSTYSISGSTVTLTGINVPLSQILLVSDATTGTVLYSMAGPAASSYTQATNSAITLATAPRSGDKLTIYYDDGVNPPTSLVSASISNFPTTQPISGTVTSARTWNLAASSDSLTAAISSLPSVSLASGQSVGISSLPAVTGNVGITSLPSVTISNPTTGTPTLGAAVSLASGQSVGISSLPAVTGTVSLSGGTVTNSNLDVALSTRLKPTDTLAGVTAVGTITNPVTIQGGNSTAVKVDGSAVTQPVSLASVPSHPVTNAGTFAVQPSGGDLTSGSQTTKIVNGANTLAIDSLGGATVNVPLSQQYTYLQSGSGAVSSGTILIPTTICSSFRSAGVQIITLGSGASFILKLSLDGGTTYTNQFLNGNVSGSQATSIGINDTTVLFACNLLNATHFQLVQGNAQTAGTSKVVVSLSQQPLSVNNPSVTFPSTSQLTSNKPVSTNTTAGGSVSTLAGGATVLGGASATKFLTVQNNNTAGNIYFSVGANSTATLPQAQCALLTPGAGFTFDVLPTSGQYLFLQSPTSGLTYSLLYA